VTTSTFEYSASAHVESLLFRVRWVLLLLVFPIALYDKGNAPFTLAFWIWLGAFAIFNLTIGLVLHFVKPLPRIALITLALDGGFFGLLPHLIESETNALAVFSIYPAVVGAIRFGPEIGVMVAAVLSLPLELRVLIPSFVQRNLSGLAITIPLIAMIAAVILIGYLSTREREAAVSDTQDELEELRRTSEGANLLYQSIEKFSTTTNYEPVIETMLEAGLKGLPTARPQEGLPVAMALIFNDSDPQHRLQVIASRNLSRRDLDIRIPGAEGIVAETLQNGSATVFDEVRNDSELGSFAALRRCHAGVCYPLQSGLEQYGVVVLAGVSMRRPGAQYLNLMRAFTHQAAIAFQAAKLYQSIREEHDQLLRSDNEMRQKLVRDLHDGPTQKVSAIVMQTEHISKLIDRDHKKAKEELQHTRALADAAVKELRTALFILRPLTLETKGLSAAIKQYCERLESENVLITSEPGEFGIELEMNIAATAFAIMEEAVNNARKHSGGAAIHVSLARQNSLLVATVQDNGPGFNLDRVTHSYGEKATLGLQNMRERARLIDGDLRIDTSPGRGTRITLIAPLPKHPA
jgi:signal transduction histidine kinase